MTEQIIALGGGGFSDGSEPGLDEYILGQARNRRPRIGFIGTASGDSDSYLLKFYSRFSQLQCQPTHLPLFRRTPSIAAWVQEQDVIFVGGGNTKSMLAAWTAWDLALHLRTALANGTVLSGVSAGAICWFESGVTDSGAGALTALDCLGFLPGSCCPHYLMEAERKPKYHQMILDGESVQGVAIDDGVAVHFIDGRPKAIVSASPHVSAYSVSLSAGKVTSIPIPGVEQINVASKS